MADGLITYEDAVGLPSVPTPAPSSSDTAAVDYEDRPLTVTPRSNPAGKIPTLPSSSETSHEAAPSGLISYEDAVTPDTPHPGAILSNSSDDTNSSSFLKGLGTTLIKGASHIPGLVGDAMDLGDYLIARAQSKITGRPLEDIQAQQIKDRKADWTDPRNILPSGNDVAEPVLKAVGEYKPVSLPAKLAMAGGEAAIGGLAFGGGAGAAALNAAGGAAAQGATDITGDPLYGLAAGAVVPGAAHLAGTAVNRVVSPAVMGVTGIDRVPVIGPRVAAARDNAAAAQVVGEASDPAALRDWAAQPSAAPDVPSSPQTLAGSVGFDRGLFQAEKDARNADNIPFNAVDRAQSNAQRAAITSAQPEGDVFRPGQVITQRLTAIDAAARRAEEQLNAAHQDAVTQRQMASRAYADQQRSDLTDRTIARGQDSGDQKAAADAAAQAAHDRLVQSFHDAHEQATQSAVDAAAPLQAVPTPEQIGATLRTAQQEATSAAKQVRDGLYRAVDPDGTLATVVTPLKAAKKAIASAIDRHTGVQPIGAEAKLWSDIDRLPDVIPFKSLTGLDSRVTAAMADARRNPSAEDPQALSRLTQLKSAVMSTIHDGVENQAAHEARLVETGVMPAADMMESRFGQALEAEANAFRTARARATGSDSGQGSRNAQPGRSSGISGVGGAEGASFGRFRDAPRDQGLAADAGLTPNFDAEASERLSAAKTSHADYAQTFKNPTVSPVLKTNGFAGQYELPAGAIPSRAIVAGDKGFETANAFLNATGRAPAAVAALRDAALIPLRKAVPPVGTLHPNALARWKQAYDGAIRALDAVAPGFSERFNDAGAATQAVLDLGIRQKQALAASQKAAARDAAIANLARREALGQANQADRAQVNALLSERTADDRAATNQSSAQTAEGIAQARGIARDAHATAAGQFAAQGGNRIAPAEVENVVGSMLKTGTGGATRMQSLVASVAQDPEALAGLRKAGVDWMLRSFQNADGTMSGAKFISFIRDNRDTLKELYPTAQVSMFGAVARDIEANAKWRTETAIKSGPGTAKDIRPMLEKAVEEGKRHMSITGAATAGFLAGGPKGATVGASLYLLNTLRSAGIRSVNDLYREALLDPEKARYLISKMPASVEGGKLRALSGVLRRELVIAPQALNQDARSLH